VRAELYWIEGPWPGRLAIMPRPRGGDWLEDEVRSWQQAGVAVVVSLLTAEEIAELDLTQEPACCRASGVEFVSYPIPDRGVPSSRTAAAELTRRLEGLLAGGKGVAIHCRAGVGRSGLLAACLLVRAGLETQAAFTRISTARGWLVPDTPEQAEWVAGPG
jgi:protein-tyrosine phosphatase